MDIVVGTPSNVLKVLRSDKKLAALAKFQQILLKNKQIFISMLANPILFVKWFIALLCGW